MENKNRWLSLSRNTTGPRYITDSEGKPFHLFGMARARMCAAEDEDPVYGGIDGLCKHFKNLGCNSFRYSFMTHDLNNREDEYVEKCGGYNPEGIRKFIETYLDPEIQTIISHDMYVVLDLHNYPSNHGSGDPNPVVLMREAREQYIPLWAGLAKFYKDEPMIAMYELWNEPYAADQGTLSVGDDGYLRSGSFAEFNWNAYVRQFFFECVEEVRKYDKRHMIMVSDCNAGWGPGWAMTWLGYSDKVDSELRNTLFSVHCERIHLENRIVHFEHWWESVASLHNVCLQFGEIELETTGMSEQAMRNLITMFESKAETHHYSGFLWRPHNDEITHFDYAYLWSDFAKKYNSWI